MFTLFPSDANTSANAPKTEKPGGSGAFATWNPSGASRPLTHCSGGILPPRDLAPVETLWGLEATTTYSIPLGGWKPPLLIRCAKAHRCSLIPPRNPKVFSPCKWALLGSCIQRGRQYLSTGRTFWIASLSCSQSQRQGNRARFGAHPGSAGASPSRLQERGPPDCWGVALSIDHVTGTYSESQQSARCQSGAKRE
mgnify:CR=1 FL=1